MPGRGARRPRATAGRSTTSRPGAAVEHRVVPWDEVSLEEGTGIVHIAHRLRRRGLRARHGARPAGADAGRRGRPLLRRLRLAARPVDHRGRGSDRRRPRRARASSSRPATYEHRYPHCWRCDTPLIFRISDDWFIGVDGVREQLLEANATVEWVPAYMGKRMDDWLRNMGDWNISRRRYYGLPLPFYPCALRAPERDRVEGASCASARSRASTSSRSCAGPWVDRVPIRVRGVRRAGDARRRGRRRLARRRHRPVLDARLGEPGVGRRRLRDRRRARPDDAPTCPITRTGSSGSRPTGSRRCASRSGSGSTRSSSCRSSLVGRAPFKRGARLREDARRARPRDARLVGEHDRRPRTRSRAWAPT